MSTPDLERYRTAGQLFDDLIDRPRVERDMRLAEMDKLDPAMAQFVRELLAADENPNDTLDEGPVALAPGVLEQLAGRKRETKQPSVRTIGPYRVIDLIGRGGMGEVLLAERADGQYEQKVAVKLLKRGMDTERVLKRFLQERRILARLAHPHIARLLDGGMTEDGLPYFVMEYVEGEPITQFAKSWRLGTRERVELMLHVCEAVEFAHRNLIVHRDLKPSNILVGASGGLKLLDFGIAKLLTESEDDSLTETGMRVMTPAYAAPEQILGEAVTTSTDVYTLGLLLYELLTGQLPPRRGGEPAPVDERSRDSFERPSALLRRAVSGENAPPKGERAAAARALAGDLDNIVLRALHREPDRRYRSAGALADDLRRWLDGRPIASRRANGWYRAGKFITRHRVGVAAASIATIALIVGSTMAIWQANIARDEARRAERVKDFLVSIFRAADPTRTKGEQLTAHDILDAGVRRIEAELPDDPIVQADLNLSIADIRNNRGNYRAAADSAAAALAVYERTLDPDDLRIGRALAALGEARYHLDEYEPAHAVLQRARAILEQHDDPVAVSQVIANLAGTSRVIVSVGAGVKLQRQALDLLRATLPPNHPDVGDIELGLAELLEEAQDYPASEASYRAAIASIEPVEGRLHPDVLRAKIGLAGLLDRLSRRDEAAPLFDEGIAGQMQVFGAESEPVAQSRFSRGIFRMSLQDHAGAEADFRAVLAVASGNLRAHAQRYLGICLTNQQRFLDAISPLEKAESAYTKIFGPENAQAMRSRANRGYALFRAGGADGLDMQRDAIASLERILSPTAYELVRPMIQLGECERAAGQADAALVMHRRALGIAQSVLGADHGTTAEALNEVASDLVARGDEASLAEARTLLAQAIANREKAGDPATLGDVLLTSARVAEKQGDRKLAKSEAARAVAALAQARGDADARTNAARELLARL